MSKFKVGELCLLVGIQSHASKGAWPYLGEVVEVTKVSHWWKALRPPEARAPTTLPEYDYEIRTVDGVLMLCMESCLRKKPPPDEASNWAVVRLISGYQPRESRHLGPINAPPVSP